MSAFLTLIFILLAALLVKVPALNLPLAGYFGSSQAMNAMMAEMMSWQPVSSLVIPRSFILIDGSPSLHLLHYPFGSLTAFLMHSLFKGNLDLWGHAQASVSMLLAAVFLYFIVKEIFDRGTALLSVFIFSFSPMILIMGVNFQNEAAALFFLLASFWLAMQKGNGALFSAGILFSCALSARIHFLSCLPAFLVYLWIHKRSARQFFLFIIGCAAPISAWYGFVYYLHLTQTGIMTSLYDQVGEGRILASAFWLNKAFYERIFDILFGEWMTPLIIFPLVLGFFLRDLKALPFQIWLLGALGTILLLPQKVFDHPFYLIHGIPAASVLAGMALNKMRPHFSKISGLAFVMIFLFLSLRYYLPPGILSRMDGFRIRKIGQEVQNRTQSEDRVIASYGSSPELLYYTGRLGWPFNVQMIEELKVDRQRRFLRQVAAGYGVPVRWLEYLRGEGASYFVIASPEEFYRHAQFSDYVKEHYSSLPVPDSSFLLFDLRNKIQVQGQET